APSRAPPSSTRFPYTTLFRSVPGNVLYVDQERDSPWLLSHTVHTEAAHWIDGGAPAAGFDCAAQVRYRQHEEPCRVQVNDDGSVDRKSTRLNSSHVKSPYAVF